MIHDPSREPEETPPPDRGRTWTNGAPLRPVRPVTHRTSAGTDVALRVADALVNLAEFSDPYYRGSTALTRVIAQTLCDHLHLSEDARSDVLLAAVLRDVGRILMQARGQLKPVSKPGPEDQRVIQQHVLLGLGILEGTDLPARVIQIIRHHHERWDGGGYPDGLAGEDVLLEARIVGIADSVASMLRPRPYRLPRSFKQVVLELKRQSGSQFDPRLVGALVELLDRDGLRSLGVGERQHVLVAPRTGAREELLAIRLSRLGYLAEVRDIDEVRERTLKVPVEAVILHYDADPISCNRVIGRLRASDEGGDVPILVVEALGASAVSEALGAGADYATASSDFETVQQVLAVLISQSVRLRTRRETASGGLLPAMTGRLEEFDVGWLMQWINYNGASGAIDVDHRGVSGTIWMANGEAHDARLGELTGMEALRHLLGWPAGRFALRMGERPPRRSIDDSLVHILMEHRASQAGDAVLYGAVEGKG